MAGNKIVMTFAGDADSLTKAAKKSEQALAGVDSAADKSGKQLSNASKSSTDLGTKMGHLGSAVSGASDAFDAIGGSLQAVTDLQNAGAEKTMRLKRALVDVEQAQEDFNQALRDGSQAAIDSGQAQIDLEQANLDASTGLKAYNKAVKEHGVNSDEARQAAIDLKQAQQDVAQANEDSAQFTRDAAQATIDAKTAQLDLNDANRAAHPPQLQGWADDLQMVTPLISAAAGVVGLLTAAQWLWNASLWASPVTWIVLAIAALVAIIVIIATKTTWFQDLWRIAWGGIKTAALWVWDEIKKGASGFWDYIKKVWDYILSIPDKIKSAFVNVGNAILAPFKVAFAAIADAWNNGPGNMKFDIPWWAGPLGGAHFEVPKVPKYHTGGIVSGAMGSETLAVLQAGERVTPMGGDGSHAEPILLGSDGSDFGDFLVDQIRAAVARRGGDPASLFGSSRG